MNYIETIIDSSIAVIKICREPQLNALNKNVIKQLSKELDNLKLSNKVRVVIITGSGKKAFVAGADIKEFSNYNVEQGRELSSIGQKTLFDKIENYNKPVIAAINGYALGGGLELALSCHIRIASSNSKMGLPECSLGLIPGYGGTQRLVRILGPSRASEMILTSQIIDADFAEKTGIINYQTSKEELIPLAKKIAKSCIKNSPKALEAAIKCINKNFDDSGLKFEQNAFGALFETDEFKEGVSAFLEKRKPNF